MSALAGLGIAFASGSVGLAYFARYDLPFPSARAWLTCCSHFELYPRRHGDGGIHSVKEDWQMMTVSAASVSPKLLRLRTLLMQRI